MRSCAPQTTDDDDGDDADGAYWSRSCRLQRRPRSEPPRPRAADVTCSAPRRHHCSPTLAKRASAGGERTRRNDLSGTVTELVTGDVDVVAAAAAAFVVAAVGVAVGLTERGDVARQSWSRCAEWHRQPMRYDGATAAARAVGDAPCSCRLCRRRERRGERLQRPRPVADS